MTFPMITVVVPSFNQARFLERTLCSILDQNYPNLELIVMDGGSTDGSVKILERYASSITYWVSRPDKGQTHALIEGFSRASGEIECWLNSDDLFQPGCLFEVAEFFARHPEADAVYGDATWIDPEDKVLRIQREIGFSRFIWMYTYDYIPGMSMFWRRSLYEKVGGLDPSYQLAMDADLFIRFAHAGHIAHVRRQWSKMRFYPQQKNVRLRSISDAEDRRIRERYWGTGQPSLLGLRRCLAQSLRVAWRLVTGCYYPGYRRYLSLPQ